MPAVALDHCMDPCNLLLCEDSASHILCDCHPSFWRDYFILSDGIIIFLAGLERLPTRVELAFLIVSLMCWWYG